MKVCPKCKTGHTEDLGNCIDCNEDLRNQSSLGGDDLAGMIIGEKYVLEDLIGEGGMAWVYRARHLQLERKIIVKLLKTTTGDDRWVWAFNNEVRALSALNHPHIVSVIDAGQTRGGFFYFVTEYIPGQTLHDLLVYQSDMPLSRAFGIMHQVMAAVEEAHAMNVIHRDLKPANILVSELRSGDDFVKVFDFGIAILKGNEDPVLEGEETFCGTAGYVAPECIAGEDASEASDVYALGVILYQMLAGVEPFESENTKKALLAQIKGAYTPPSEAIKTADLPKYMDELIKRALSPNPKTRYSNVSEFREALIVATRKLGSLKLRCDKCTRPIDPSTGYCELHKIKPTAEISDHRPESETLKETIKPPQGRRENSRPPDTDWGNLLDIVLRDGIDSSLHAEAGLEFLLGDSRVLEIVGKEGSGKTALAFGLSKAAEFLGLDICSTGRSPSMMNEPWWQVRKVVSRVLDIDVAPRDIEDVKNSAYSMAVSPLQADLLAALFGFLDYRSSSKASRPSHEKLLGAAVETLVIAKKPRAIDAVFAVDLNNCDYASRDFFRTLVSKGCPWRGKLIVTSQTPSLMGTPKREEIKLEPSKDANSFERLVEQLKLLPEDALDAFYLVASIGADTDAEILKPLVGEDTVFLAMQVLIQAGLATAAPGHCISIVNQFTANQVLSQLKEVDRQGLHNRLFEVLSDRNYPVSTLAEHAELAGRFEEALKLFEKSGDRAVKWFDPETAALVHYHRAIHIARWKLLIPDNNGLLLNLSLKQGSALMNAGHLLAAELIFKDILKDSKDHPLVMRQARAGLETISVKV